MLLLADDVGLKPFEMGFIVQKTSSVLLFPVLVFIFLMTLMNKSAAETAGKCRTFLYFHNYFILLSIIIIIPLNKSELNNHT